MARLTGPWSSSPVTSAIGKREAAPATFLDLDQRRRRRVVLAATVRTVLTLAVIVGGYALVPVDGFATDAPAAAWLRLLAIALIFLTSMILQVQLVISARVPQVRAAEAVVESVVFFLCLFSLLYCSLSATDPASFSEPLNRIDALYFTTATFATVGFGDVAATSTLARSTVTLQMVTGLGLLVLIARVAFYAARLGLQRR